MSELISYVEGCEHASGALIFTHTIVSRKMRGEAERCKAAFTCALAHAGPYLCRTELPTRTLTKPVPVVGAEVLSQAPVCVIRYHLVGGAAS